MCGGCAGAPLDWAAAHVSGVHERTAVARRISTVLRRDTVLPITSGWTVNGATGFSVVCRTYDELIQIVSTRSGRPIPEVREIGLGLAGKRTTQ
ncbi:hypothetical protein H351_30715 (plasmid) [Rhodococcus erythropolis R138]|nr:hypothetical protein H351_30715 [Rhodococcus erythropolis R138]